MSQAVLQGAQDVAARSSARDTKFDIARGVGIILVVLGHALVGVQQGGLTTPLMHFLIIGIYSTHMALFFIISGVFSGSMAKRAWPEFSLAMLTRIVWPYLLWGFVLYTAHFLMGGFTNTQIKAYNLWSVIWPSGSVMWFFQALLAGMVLRRLLAGVSLNVTGLVGLALVAVAYIYPFWGGVERFVGLFLIAAWGRPLLPKALSPLWVGLSAVVMVVTLGMVWQDAQLPLQGYPAFVPKYIPALLAGPILVLWGAARLSAFEGLLARGLEYIGQHTMPIFVTHILITAGTRIALRLGGLDDPVLAILVGTVFGVGLPLIAAVVAQKLRLSAILGWR